MNHLSFLILFLRLQLDSTASRLLIELVINPRHHLESNNILTLSVILYIICQIYDTHQYDSKAFTLARYKTFSCIYNADGTIHIHTYAVIAFEKKEILQMLSD